MAKESIRLQDSEAENRSTDVAQVSLHRLSESLGSHHWDFTGPETNEEMSCWSTHLIFTVQSISRDRIL